MVREVGLRERKKRATRAALAESALRLCVENGFDAVTAERIAGAAGVSLRTFFNYFPSKEEAVVAAEVARAEAIVREFAGRPAHEPVLVALRNTLHRLLAGRLDRDDAARLRALRATPALLPYQTAAYAAKERQLAEAVARRVGADPDADLYPTLFAAAVMATLRVVVGRWLDSPTTPLSELVDALVHRLGSGFGDHVQASRTAAVPAQASQVTGSECTP
ncbi:acyl-CoA-like ligand-binding transcription factor [Saccharothrix violaceirubra]|uniref:AcrR family transcriptional regulator n=1 Tax=Saccharothrix violaceirubra TaxID=413306 RepID=A0A7W7WWB2_9PSEU|nr:TetR family transcriptional regulator [Saccharothrix violaceirubra]MBB4965807.1 AcrR family transcriptional regulator [Saccharothrix violaceirubra]